MVGQRVDGKNELVVDRENCVWFGVAVPLYSHTHTLRHQSDQIRFAIYSDDKELHDARFVKGHFGR